jgi:hypothetical protein
VAEPIKELWAMHVYTDGTTTIAAHSTEEASRFSSGDDWELFIDEWRQLDDDQKLTVTDVDEPGKPKETHTCREWAAMFTETTELGSTEY